MTLLPLFDIVAEGRWWSCFKLRRAKGHRTDVFQIVAKADSLTLAEIRWYGPWRRYALFPRPETVWEVTCLREVASLLVSLTHAHLHQRDTPKEPHDA